MGSIKKCFATFFLLAFLMTSCLTLQSSAQVYRKSATEEKKIALTFDDGPSKRNTEEILSILREYQIKATFFVIGKNAEKDPDRILSIQNEGHEIGNHTYSHAYITNLSEKELTEEVEKTERILRDITGKTPSVFRPPGGFYDDSSIELIEKLGYKSVLWSLDTRDWSMPRAESIVSKVEGRTATGDILLFHDLNDKRLPTPEALKKILPYLVENGYQFVTVSELLQEEA